MNKDIKATAGESQEPTGTPAENPPDIAAAVEAAFNTFLRSISRGPDGRVVADGQRRLYWLRQQLSHTPDGWYQLFPNGLGRYAQRGDRPDQARTWTWQPPAAEAAPETPATPAAGETAAAEPDPAPVEPAADPAPAAEPAPVEAPAKPAPPAGEKPADTVLDQIVDSPFATHRTPEPAAEKPTEAMSAPAEKPAEATAPAEEEEEERATTFPAKLTAALRYAECGFPVLPLHSITENGGCTCGKTDCSSPGKHPRTLHGLKDASMDPDIIRRWRTQWPDANIGIVTGAVSGLLVVDIDGAEGERSRDALIATHGPLPETLPARTGRGWHLYFKLPANCGSIRGSAGKLGKGIDTRADDGYVVAPPSVHASGIEYEFIGGFDPQRIALAPDWLLALLMGQRAAAQAPQQEQEKKEGGEPQQEQEQQQAQAQARIPLDSLRISKRLRALIRDGKPRGERSEAIRSVLLGLIIAGYGNDLIIAVMMNPANGLSEKPRQKGRAWFDGELRRAREQPLPRNGSTASGTGAESCTADETTHAQESTARPDAPEQHAHTAQAQAASITVDDLKILPGLKALIGAGMPGEQQSGVVWFVVNAMLRAGHDNAEITAVMFDPGNKLGEKLREQGPAWFADELQKAREKAAATAAPGEQRLELDPTAPLAIAKLFVAQKHMSGGHQTLYHHTGDFHSWDGCCYRPLQAAAMRSALYEYLDAAVKRVRNKLTPFKPSTIRVSQVVDALTGATYLSNLQQPPVWLRDAAEHPPAAEMVACANGLLHLPTGELLPATPLFFTPSAVDFAFDPAAPPPVEWLKFLHSLWPDNPEAIALLCEWFGYLLTGDTSQQKGLMIVGPKRSGKGTIGRVAVGLLGKANMCAPTLASLGQPFGLAPLIGKQLALISDARLGSRADQQFIAERLLSITGEDPLTIDRKFREPWTGQLGVRFMITTNELPRIDDASGALPSRFLVLLLQHSFYGREDHELARRLLKELPSILNWAMEGWRTLQQRGYFLQPASSAEAIRDLEDLASPVGAFIRDCCEVGPALTAACDLLFQRWRTWCSAQGRNYPGTAAGFGRDLRAAVAGLEVDRPRGEGGSRERHYRGVGLRAEEQNGTEGGFPGFSRQERSKNGPGGPSNSIL